MLSRKEVASAQNFNKRMSGRIWDVSKLPWPWSMFSPDSLPFAEFTAYFQDEQGLLEDGMLGRATLSTMRAKIQEENREQVGILEEDLAVSKRRDRDGNTATSRPLPEHVGLSNAVVISGKSVRLPQAALDAGVTCSNYLDDGEYHFDHYTRKSKLQHLVYHESVTRDQPHTVRILKRRKTESGKHLGVHLILAPDGHFSCHVDLADETCVHGNQLNRTSIGFEWVNPYYAKRLKAPFTETLEREWWTHVPNKYPKLYVKPTQAQLRSAELVVPWLCGQLGIPFEFPTANLSSRKRRITGWDDKKAKPKAGIVAHRDFSAHSDGRFPLEQLMEKHK